MKKVLSVMIFLLANCALSADIKAGEEKANSICMACHGINGVSQNSIWPNLAGQGRKYIIKQLKDYRSGARKSYTMQPQAMILTEEEIENVALFYSSQKTPEGVAKGVGEEPEKLLALAENLYKGGDLSREIPACSACHNPNGAGIEPAMFPSLSAQHSDYTRTQLLNFKNSAEVLNQASDAQPLDDDHQRANDPNEMMRDVVKKLTPKEIEALSLYLQGLH